MIVGDFVPVVADYEFIPLDDGSVDVVCGVATNLLTGEQRREWRDGMRPSRPTHDWGPKTLLVAHYAPAEIEVCFSMGWPAPRYVFDTMAEHLLITNGQKLPFGISEKARAALLTARRLHGLPCRDVAEKKGMIERILAGPPYDAGAREAILNYCAEDVDDTVGLFETLMAKGRTMSPQYLDQALTRGGFAVAIADMTRRGFPIDVDLHDRLMLNHEEVKAGLIASVADFGVFHNGVFKQDRFSSLVQTLGAEDVWPTTAGGAYATDETTMRKMAQQFSALEPFREVYTTLQQMKKPRPFGIGPDGRYRLGKMELGLRRLGMDTAEVGGGVGFGAFRTKTSRNAPAAKEFLPARANWVRTLVTPQTPDRLVGEFDYASEEYGIAAYLSDDPNMIEDYLSGDVYMALGVRAGFAPEGATKKTHPKERSMMKPVVLGTQYGQQAHSIGRTLAAKLGMDSAAAQHTAEEMLRKHRQAYGKFWAWQEGVIDAAYLSGEIRTPLGWRMIVGDQPPVRDWDGGTKPTTLYNWPMQAAGSDIMRVAVTALIAAGVEVICPVHDSVLIECDVADKDEVARVTIETMKEASRIVLGGPEIGVDGAWIPFGKTWRDPEKGDAMWAKVSAALNKGAARKWA